MHRIITIALIVSLTSACRCAQNSRESCTTNRKQYDSSRAAVNIIFETDLGNDIDDVIALDMLYKYAAAKRINLLGISINKDGRAPAELADIFNCWYGMPDVPVAVIRNGRPSVGTSGDYAAAVCAMPFERSPGWNYDELPESSEWYRRQLAAAADSSLTVVSVGFASNLLKLLGSGPDSISPLSGRELVGRKVRELVLMAGCFCDTTFCEYNVATDIASARAIFSEWPTAVVCSPFEVGNSIVFPGSLIEANLGCPRPHPAVEAYKAFEQMPYDRETWDPTALLYAVEGGRWFTLSEPGQIQVRANGATVFVPSASRDSGKCERRFLQADSVQAAAIRNHFIEILTSACEAR